MQSTAQTPPTAPRPEPASGSITYDAAKIAEQDRALLLVASRAAISLGKFTRDALVKRAGVKNLTAEIDRAIASGHLSETPGDALHTYKLRMTRKGWIAAGLTPPPWAVDYGLAAQGAAP